MDGSWLLELELAIGREYDEGSISVTGGTLLSLGVSSDVMAVNGSWLLDELVLGREHHNSGTTAYVHDIAIILRLSSRK